MERKGDIKHLGLLKFKDSVPQDTIDQLIKTYANLVNVIPPFKSFQWGLNVVDHGNFSHGFTHVFESTFESTEGRLEYKVHPAHTEYGEVILPHLEKFLTLDYVPKTLEPPN